MFLFFVRFSCVRVYLLLARLEQSYFHDQLAGVQLRSMSFFQQSVELHLTPHSLLGMKHVIFSSAWGSSNLLLNNLRRACQRPHSVLLLCASFVFAILWEAGHLYSKEYDIDILQADVIGALATF